MWMTLGADGPRGETFSVIPNTHFSFSSNDDTFDWILAGSTPTPNTGPKQAWTGTKASFVSIINTL